MAPTLDYRCSSEHSPVAGALVWCNKHRVSLIALSVAVVLVYAGTWGTARWRQRSRQIIETLQQPAAFAQWTADGVVLSDGHELKLPSVRNIKPDSVALAEVAKYGGVEFSAGRAYGLIKVWHWCGNDPVRLHLARVDLSRLLIFLGEAEPSTPATTQFDRLLDRPRRPHNGFGFSAYGWDVGEFLEFRSYCELADLQQAPPATGPATTSTDSPES